jgi:hypothetical protein
VEGSKWDLNSYWAELRGILAAIELFTNDTPCSITNIYNGQFTLYCDSKGALYAAFGHKRPTPRWSSFNLVDKIRTALQNLPITWKYTHVEGHQDSHHLFHQLDYFAQGNIIVDHLASKKLEEGQSITVPTPTHWLPSINRQIIRGDIHSMLKYHIFWPQMEERWMQILGVPHWHAHQCNWDIFFRALDTQSSRDIFHADKISYTPSPSR